MQVTVLDAERLSGALGRGFRGYRYRYRYRSRTELAVERVHRLCAHLLPKTSVWVQDGTRLHLFPLLRKPGAA